MAKINILPLVNISSPEGNSLIKRILKAQTTRNEEVKHAVEKILNDIRKNGDSTLF